MDTVASRAEVSTVAPLRIAVLGPFLLTWEGGALPRMPKKAQALLAFLAMHRDRSFPRDELATLLWGNSGTEQARQSLRQSLSSLRMLLAPDWSDTLLADPASVRLASSPGLEVDLDAFESLSRSSDVDDLLRAARLCRGDFLAGLQIPEEGYNDWMTVERQRLSSLRFTMLQRCAGALADAGRMDAAIDMARQSTVLDPLREEGHRLLMRLLARGGHRAEALKQYARCVQVLRDELGIAPDAATSRLADTIRQDEGPAPAVAPVVPAMLKMEGAPTPASDRASGAQGLRSVGFMEVPLAPTHDRPSIVVLPFANLSGDPAQSYFADGMTEDVTIALGREKWLFVIASASAFAMSGRGLDPVDVGSNLGVRYVLRGSVRKDGNRVRIVVQLTDAAIGGHLWSERLEDDFDHVFAMQDRLANQVAALIAPALRLVEVERAHHKPTESLTAYDLYLRALPLCRSSAEANAKALELLREAIALDPRYGAAYALAARCYHFQRMMGWVAPDDPGLAEGVRLAELAIERGRSDSETLWMAGLAIANISGDLVAGLHWIDRSLALNPSSANAWIASCFVRSYTGDPETAMEHFERAHALNPVDTTLHVQWHAAATAYFMAGRYDDADRASDRTLTEMPDYPGALRMKVATCGLLGRPEEAKPVIARLIAVNPCASVATMRVYWKDVLRRVPDAADAFILGMRHAGMPEEPTN